MLQARKISAFTTAGIFMAIISLVLCVMFLNASYSSVGIATEKSIIYSYKVKNPSTVFVSNEHINVISKPIIVDNDVIYGLNLNQIDDYSQFTFEIENTGNVAIKVKNIKITYPVELQQYVEVVVDGIAENDVIQPGATYSNIKVITKYDTGFYNTEGLLNPVLLDNIKIDVEFYE